MADPIDHFSIAGMLRDWGSFALTLVTAVVGMVTFLASRIFIAGQRHRENRAELDAIRRELAELNAWREEMIPEHKELMMSVNTLPTREEQQAQFERLTARIESGIQVVERRETRRWWR